MQDLKVMPYNAIKNNVMINRVTRTTGNEIAVSHSFSLSGNRIVLNVALKYEFSLKWQYVCSVGWAKYTTPWIRRNSAKDSSQCLESMMTSAFQSTTFSENWFFNTNTFTENRVPQSRHTNVTSLAKNTNIFPHTAMHMHMHTHTNAWFTVQYQIN